LQHLQQQKKWWEKKNWGGRERKKTKTKNKKQNQGSKKAKREDIHAVNFQLQASMFVKLEKLQAHWWWKLWSRQLSIDCEAPTAKTFAFKTPITKKSWKKEK
jgi:hypothetical protein